MEYCYRVNSVGKTLPSSRGFELYALAANVPTSPEAMDINSFSLLATQNNLRCFDSKLWKPDSQTPTTDSNSVLRFEFFDQPAPTREIKRESKT